MRGVILSVLLLLCSLGGALAYTEDELALEFDARGLTAGEKRFLQAGLALAGTYTALIDGAWGEGSQRALERFAADSGLEGPVPNWAVVMLAVETLTEFDNAGWEERYLDGLDISLMSPTRRIRDGKPSDSFVNFNHSDSSLGYSLTRGPVDQRDRLHRFTLDQARPGTEPYVLRRDTVWISSVRSGPGRSLYTRSDLRGTGWSTVMLSARDDDGGQLALVSGSIRPGRAPGIDLPEGTLTRGIRALAAVLGQDPAADVAEADVLAELRDAMTRPAQPDGTAAAAGRTAAERPAPPAGPAPAAPDAGLANDRLPDGGLPDGELPDDEPDDNGSGEEDIFTGSGFVVTETGLVLTNDHVAGHCRALAVDGHPATLVAADPDADLALLAVPDLAGTPAARFAARPARLNADVTVAGYPLAGLLGGLNITRGAVTSLKGLGGATGAMQISAPVQPGNSGGPVVDAAGSVVGVVVAKLDAGMVARETGDIPQNVNFAIRGEIAKLFLFQNEVAPAEAGAAPALAPEDLADQVKRFTRFVTCRN